MTYKFLAEEVIAASVVAGLSIVGYQRPEVAPATGAAAGALGAWLGKSLVLQRASIGDLLAGAAIGGAVGAVQRGIGES